MQHQHYLNPQVVQNHSYFFKKNNKMCTPKGENIFIVSSFEHVHPRNQSTVPACTPLHGHCGKITNTWRASMARQSALLTSSRRAFSYITVQLSQLSPAPICSNHKKKKKLKLNATERFLDGFNFCSFPKPPRKKGVIYLSLSVWTGKHTEAIMEKPAKLKSFLQAATCPRACHESEKQKASQ